MRTIKSFNRPVILVDDLLHKGYRMNAIDPILKANQVEVVDTVAGVQTGRGRDLMTIKERPVEDVYKRQHLESADVKFLKNLLFCQRRFFSGNFY